MDSDFLVLSCEVPDSVPHPQVTWSGLSTQQTSDGRVTHSQNGTLIFSFFRNTDSSVYQCTVTNPARSVMSSQYLPQLQGLCIALSFYEILVSEIMFFCDENFLRLKVTIIMLQEVHNFIQQQNLSSGQLPASKWWLERQPSLNASPLEGE